MIMIVERNIVTYPVVG